MLKIEVLLTMRQMTSAAFVEHLCTILGCSAEEPFQQVHLCPPEQGQQEFAMQRTHDQCLDKEATSRDFRYYMELDNKLLMTSFKTPWYTKINKTKDKVNGKWEEITIILTHTNAYIM